MKPYTALIVGTALALNLASGKAAEIDAEKVDRSLCAVCHGVGGSNTNPTYPQLAGQVPAYTKEQLLAFKNKTRADKDARDYMWGWAALLSDAQIDALASYYAAQKPSPGIPGNPRMIEQGESIYERGIPSQNVPACSSCHGKDGEGIPPNPRVAGQHATYLIKQLNVFKGQARPAAVAMHQIVQTLTPDEIQAVAVFMQSK